MKIANKARQAIRVWKVKRAFHKMNFPALEKAYKMLGATEEEARNLAEAEINGYHPLHRRLVWKAKRLFKRF